MELTAMPHMFSGEFDPKLVSTPEAQTEFLKKFMPKAVEETVINGIQIYKSPSGQGRFYYFAVAKSPKDGREAVSYMMHLNPIEVHIPENDGMKKVRGAYQGAVWRDPNFMESGNDAVPALMFWRVQAQHPMFSDIYQSQQGQTFWRHRITQALKAGKQVWAIHVKPESRTAEIDQSVQLKFPEDANDYWSNYKDHPDEWGAYWRFLIV